jgi:NADPH-dependent 2,4-dienoyl-CoA reductase/sulfur reductase-like enzyme/nitrite reductase/ring-hydroxylating ferredoxin subunit
MFLRVSGRNLGSALGLRRSELARIGLRPLLIGCNHQNSREPRHGLYLSGFAAAGGLFLSTTSRSDMARCASTREITVGRANDFLEGELYEVPVGDDKHVLISRHEGKLYAIGSKCSHYGYPLAKGVKCGNEVVCPLHDATFDVKTGKPLRGPGLDAIPTYPVRVSKSGVVIVTVPADAFPAKVSASYVKRDPKNATTYVIVGGGAAGLTAAETLREEGFTGRIVLISAESHLPYDRPVLSKKLPLKGKIDGLYLRNSAHFDSADIEVKLGAKVDVVDTGSKTVKFGSEELKYDKVLIASGGRPRELFIPGSDAKNVFLLRTVDDALAINDFAAEKGQRVVVIGGSFIGMEIASTLIQKGVDVTVVAKTSVPYERVLGKKVGAFFANLLSEREIRYIGSSSAKLIRTDKSTGAVTAVELDDGDVIPADAVIIGAGVIPNCPLGKDSAVKLASDGSIPCTPFLNSKADPSVFAAGDVCTFPYVKTGEDLRVEHWDVAIQQGRVAARNMLGKKVPFNEIPYFWTMVFGKSLRYVGNVGSEGTTFDNVIIEGDLIKGEFVAYYTKKDRIAAVATVGKDPVAVACAELLRANLMPSVAEIQLGVANSQTILQRVKDLNDEKKRTKLLKQQK